MIEAIDPTHIHLTSILYILNVFDNLYMLWMCIWMRPHHGTAANVGQACGILLQVWATLRWYVMVKWGEWGYRPNPYSSHIHIIYIKDVWQPLYAVDVHMDVSTPRYGRSCRPSFWNFATNLGKSSRTPDPVMVKAWEDRSRSEPSKVLRVSTAIYQHPPHDFMWRSQMESEKQCEMDKETQRNN